MCDQLKKSLRSSDHRFPSKRCVNTSNSSRPRTRAISQLPRKVRTSRRLRKCLTLTRLPSPFCPSTLGSVSASYRIIRSRTSPCSHWRHKRVDSPRQTARMIVTSSSRSKAGNVARFTGVSRPVQSPILRNSRCLVKSLKLRAIKQLLSNKISSASRRNKRQLL